MKQELIIEKINKTKFFLSSNNLQEAKKEILDCIKLNKDETQAYYYLIKIYIKENKEKEAIQYLQEAINYNPKNIQYYLFLAEIYFNNLNEFLYKLIELYESILVMNYVDDVILYRLSFLYHKTLNLNKSNEYLAKLYSYNRMQPQLNLLKQYTTISSLAFNYNYKKQENFHKKYKDFILQFEELKIQIPNKYKSWSWPKKDKIRIGFVSGDFKTHPVNFFIKSLLKYIDRSKYELIAFSTINVEDNETKITKDLFNEWNVLNVNQVEISAKKIYEKEIDILIDLSGHTANNALPVFKYKPAPIQISWLGYFASTGISEIDYFITSETCVTKDEEQYFIEKVLKLPETHLCYDFSSYNINLARNTAFYKNNYITFGFFQNLSKSSDDDIILWKKILDLNKNNKLLIKSKELTDIITKEKFLQKLISYGINLQQLILRGSTSLEEHLNQHNEVDIMLDTLNVSGGTTTCQCLYMGVPIITNKGNSMLSRQGEQFLKIIQLEDWIANSADDYIEIVKKQTQNIQNLQLIKNTLRQKVLNSSMGNGEVFAKQFEILLKSIK